MMYLFNFLINKKQDNKCVGSYYLNGKNAI